MSNDRNKNVNKLVDFTRGGQIFRNEATMFKQNIVFVMSIITICMTLIPALYFDWVTTGYERNAWVLNWLHKFYEAIGFSPDTQVKVITKEGPVRVALAERYNVSGYKQLIDNASHSVKFAFTLGLAATISLLVAYFSVTKIIGKHVTKDKHIRGASFGKYENVKKLVLKHNEEEALKLNLLASSSYTINGIPYPLLSETMHTLVAGTTGSGKTNYLVHHIEQIIARGDRAVIIDKMCSFSGKYYREGTDHILNTLDSRSIPWNMFKDVQDLTDWNNIAEIIIELPKGSANPYFAMGARSVFALTGYIYAENCMHSKTKPTITEFYNILIKSSNTELHEYLLGSEAAQHVNPEAKGQIAGIRATISNAMTAFTFLHDVNDDQPSFSVKDWVANDDINSMCFLTSSATKHATLKPLITMWFKMFITELMMQQRKTSRKVWFIIDELPSLGKLEILQSALAEVRQFGACFIIGIQAISQVKDIYGHDGADSIMALTRTKIIFNPGDPLTADTCSKFIGTREVHKTSTNFSVGRSENRDAQSVSSKLTQERILLPEQLTQLANLHAVVILPGDFPVCEVEFSYKELDNKAEGFIEDPHWPKRVKNRMAIDTTSPDNNTSRAVKRENPQQNNYSHDNEKTSQQALNQGQGAHYNDSNQRVIPNIRKVSQNSPKTGTVNIEQQHTDHENYNRTNEVPTSDVYDQYQYEDKKPSSPMLVTNENNDVPSHDETKPSEESAEYIIAKQIKERIDEVLPIPTRNRKIINKTDKPKSNGTASKPISSNKGSSDKPTSSTHNPNPNGSTPALPPKAKYQSQQLAENRQQLGQLMGSLSKSTSKPSGSSDDNGMEFLIDMDSGATEQVVEPYVQDHKTTMDKHIKDMPLAIEQNQDELPIEEQEISI